MPKKCVSCILESEKGYILFNLIKWCNALHVTSKWFSMEKLQSHFIKSNYIKTIKYCLTMIQLTYRHQKSRWENTPAIFCPWHGGDQGYFFAHPLMSILGEAHPYWSILGGDYLLDSWYGARYTTNSQQIVKE